jgi:type I restriction enzyme R subunit
VPWKEAGGATELDYTKQASWLLFLKYHDSIADAVADLGRPEEIEVFAGFQKYLYARQGAAGE